MMNKKLGMVVLSCIMAMGVFSHVEAAASSDVDIKNNASVVGSDDIAQQIKRAQELRKLFGVDKEEKPAEAVVSKPVIKKAVRDLDDTGIDNNKKQEKKNSFVKNFSMQEKLSMIESAIEAKEAEQTAKEAEQTVEEAEDYRLFARKTYKQNKRLSSGLFKKIVAEVPAEPTVIFEKNVPTYKEDYASENCQMLPYAPGLTNDIMLRVGYVTDITLPRGDVLQRITSGDSQRFKYETYFDRSSSTWHLYAQPLQKTASTNIVISTDKHIFHADLKVADFCQPTVKWDIPDMINIQNREHVQFKVNNIGELNFKYSKYGGRGKAWRPRSVFDDKQMHTFINFKEGALKGEAPIVFMERNGSIELVPSKLQGNTMVIDRIADRFMLKMGNEVIEYRRRV